MVIKRTLIIDSYSDICKDDPKLRPYQQKAKKEIFESWDEIDNVMFQMPTGTGKTRLFTSIIRDINDYSIKRREAVKILIIAHRTELIDQIDESLRKYQVVHNVIAGGRDRNYKYPVSVASIQTITHPNNLRDAKKLNAQFVIIDEAHHALAATYKKLWDMYPDSKKLGVTATPWRMNHQSFTDLFDKLVLSIPIKDFINQGYLAPYKYFSLRSDSDILNTIDDIELDKFGEYMESSMEEKMDIGSIRAQLLKSYLSLAEGKKGIIYAINIVHARHICKEYQEAGYTAASIDSKTPAAERDRLVDEFRRGKIDIIVNVDIFSEGFDCPDIEFIQLARPTRSLVKYLQQVGRGLRPTNNKEHCIILDNVGMYSRFGLPDARRHWKQHFMGKNVTEEPVRVVSQGTGKTRYVDLSEGTEDMELIQDVITEAFDPIPILETNSYQDDNFIFWFKENKKIYDAYIQDDTYFIISELLIDEEHHCVHRKRVGKIPMESWMFWQMEREKVDNLKSINHLGANYTIFHYEVLDKDNTTKDKYFDYKGREIESPSIIEAKFEKGERGGKLSDYIDVPVSKATFRVDLLKKSMYIYINRTLKGESKGIAFFSIQSDFGKWYYYSKGLKNSKSDHCYIYRSDEGSFSIRVDEKDRTYLYKFGLKGNLIKKGTIAGSSNNNNSFLSDADIDKLWHVFDKRATSYKYFWFLSILKILKDTGKETILYKEILFKMVSSAWEYVFDKDILFPQLDQLSYYLKIIQKKLRITNNTKTKTIEVLVRKNYEVLSFDALLSPLLKNVPYRFLSPWIPFTSNDDVVAKSNDAEMSCPYSLHEDHIVIDSKWGEFLLVNYDKLTQFTEKELRKYLKLK